MGIVKESGIVSYYDLSEEWQIEVKSNLNEHAEETMYLEPEEGHNPEEHILFDLNEAMPHKGVHEGFSYNVTIGISNNSGMLLDINDSCDSCKYIFV